MKKYAPAAIAAGICIKAVATIAILASVSSCEGYDDQPPVNEGYATTIIMPDPTDLTQEDRNYLEQLEEEYEQSIR